MPLVCLPVLLTLVASTAEAALRYVDAANPNPAPPYTNWATAARIIQDAVDAAIAGDEIVVTNGVYSTGGRAVVGTMTNRVAVRMPLTVRSVNGAEVTIIQGHQVPGTTNGDGAIRCVYLADGASLYGFTLTKGGTQNLADGGGAWCESTNALLFNCVLKGNAAAHGGGGAWGGTLNNCSLSYNTADLWGGGAAESVLERCRLTDNKVNIYVGGGAYHCVMRNCALTGNSAPLGGGASRGTLNNCTLTGNSACYGSGGILFGTLNNCIVYYNSAPNGANYSGWGYEGSVMSYCCTTPLPTNGIGNIASQPELASFSHLSVTSPCRGAGSNAYASGKDIDGEPWDNPPSIGCDEYTVGQVTGSLSVAIVTAFTNVVAGFPIELIAFIEARTTASVWQFGDGVTLTNHPYALHSWGIAGDYEVLLTAYNEALPEGVSAAVMVHVAAESVHYVAADSATPLPPYTSWLTAARNIQDAVDAAPAGGDVVVNDGIYAAGGRAVYGTMTNRVGLNKPLTLRSVNGPEFTVIQGQQVAGTTNGDGAVRCVYLGEGASLSGFTLTNGATRGEPGDWQCEQSGGGIWCEPRAGIISNCVIEGNSARNAGGGVFRGTLNNCTLSNNSAGQGGGASGVRGIAIGPSIFMPVTLNNCTLIGNSARGAGGGVFCGELSNCLLSSNRAEDSGGGAYEGTLNNCVLTNNSAMGDRGYGGGANGSTLNNCMLTCNRANLGGGAIATLNNCTLANNSARVGGGAADGILNSCMLTGNSAQYSGGGAGRATLNNCVLIGNSAGDSGGGAWNGTLSNCTIVGNSAGYHGGGFDGWDSGTLLNNSIAYFNTAGSGGDNYPTNYSQGTFTYCCTTPLPTNGIGNITNAPLFVDYAGGDLHLQSNSPCINAGNNALVSGVTDLDGNPRIVSGTVDIGAYEFEGVGSTISYAWLQSFGLPTDGSADAADVDFDGHTTWQEWRCQTDPTNALSVLRLLSVSLGGTNVFVTWQSVAGVSYFLERCTDLAGFALFAPVVTNVPGQTGSTTFTDTTGALIGPSIYRVGVAQQQVGSPAASGCPAFFETPYEINP